MSGELGRLHPVVSLTQQGVIREDRPRVEEKTRKRHEKDRERDNGDREESLKGEEAEIAESSNRIDFRV